MDVGNRIKQLREAKGWTTNRLANRCGISQSFLRSVERNEKGISVASLSIVCDELGLSKGEGGSFSVQGRLTVAIMIKL